MTRRLAAALLAFAILALGYTALGCGKYGPPQRVDRREPREIPAAPPPERDLPGEQTREPDEKKKETSP